MVEVGTGREETGGTSGDVGQDGGAQVRRARPQDAGAVRALLSEAAIWQASRGRMSWQVPFPLAVVRRSIQEGETFTLFRDGALDGTLALSWEDPLFWGDRPPDAGYVHRLAVRRAAAGQGLGASLLAWASARVAARGRRWLRLDCAATNRELRRYYRALGFELVEVATIELPVELGVADPWPSALYQRPVGS